MSIRLRDLIRNVRACKTASEERAVISKECALIRTAFKDEDTAYRHRNVAKLLFIHMLGYPSHFGQMECLKLIASSKFTEKRVGYLGLSLLVDETTEVLMLVTNSLSSDLSHRSPYVVGLALAALGNVSSKDMLRDLSNQVHKLLSNSNPYIRKKAALCAARIFERVPELVEDFIDRIISLLQDRNHAVQITAVTLLIDVVKRHKTFVSKVRKTVPLLLKSLKNLVLSGYAPEHDVNGIADPFLQVKIIRLLGYLGENNESASDEMNDLLAQVTTNTEVQRNVGNSILYECVKTIMKIQAESNLRVLAINILGRFLQNKDNNIRYVALQTLGTVVSIDTHAVQQHRQTIVECLRDPDISIRARALDLIYALMSKSNAEALTRELLNYLVIASREQKEDVCSRLTKVIEKYAPSKPWHIDTLITMLSIAGNEAPPAAWQTLIVLIAQPATVNYRPEAVGKLYDALQEDSSQKGLVKAAIWTLGEFGTLVLNGNHPEGKMLSEDDIVDLLEKTRKLHSATLETKGMVLNAYLKLSSKVESPSTLEHIKENLSTFKSSMSLELQARSCEYLNILKPSFDDTLKGEWLAPMPVPTDEQLAARRVKMLEASPEDDYSSDGEGDMLDLGGGDNSGVTKPADSSGGNLLDLDDIFDATGPSTNTAPVVDNVDPLADIFGGGGTSAPSTAAAGGSTGGGDDLLDMFGGGDSSSAMNGSQQSFPPMQVLDKDGLNITFNCTPGAASGEVIVNGTYTNSSNRTFDSFLFEAAVPKYMTLKLENPSGSTIAPFGKVTQNIRLTNSKKGEKKIMMKVKITYTADGQPVQEQLTIANFHKDL